MKLVFPDGEHDPVPLSAGLHRIGAEPGGAVVLSADGIAALHCEIHVTVTGANVQVPHGGGPVSVNGRPVSDLMALRDGDQIDIGPVAATFVVKESVRDPIAAADTREHKEDVGATRVRAALPRFVLRGVSGALSDKVFPVTGPVVIGRSPECDITVPAEEISRRHAMVKPAADGLSIEDLGSSNGTYINSRRVQQGFLGPGDELRLDAVRFVLVAPGVEIPRQTAPGAAPSEPVSRLQSSTPVRRWVPIMLTAAAVLAIAALALG